MKEISIGCITFALLIILIVILWSINWVINWVINFGFNKADEISRGAVVKYEEYQEIYNTIKKLDTDICNLWSIKEDDKMFTMFSKSQLINEKKTSLNRWVEEYNAKSKVWTRSMWKSSSLPYQLDTSIYPCYSNN